MIIDDLIVLGRAVPEIRPRGGGSKGVCLAGFSKTYGFVRIDPVRPDTDVHRWDVIRVEVERKPRDTRHESWQVLGIKSGWESVNDHVEKIGSIKNRQGDKKALLESNLSTCVKAVSDNGDSLCLIKPIEIQRLEWDENPQHGQPHQTMLIPHVNEEWVYTKADFPTVPRIAYVCPDCINKQGYHDQVYIGWDAYEFLRKNPYHPEYFWRNMQFNNTEYEHYFLVGNQSIHRNSYMIIGIIWMKTDVIPSSVDYVRANGFVYLIQENDGEYTKIGLSEDVENRRNNFQTANPRELHILCKIPHDNPAKLETELHSRYKHKRVRGEWYRLDANDINEIRGLESNAPNDPEQLQLF